MSLRRRIKKLEKAEKQRNCGHNWGNIELSIPYGTGVYVRSKCCYCDLEKERSGYTKKVMSAYFVLKDLFEDIVRTETGIKPEKKKT